MCITNTPGSISSQKIPATCHCSWPVPFQKQPFVFSGPRHSSTLRSMVTLDLQNRTIFGISVILTPSIKSAQCLQASMRGTCPRAKRVTNCNECFPGQVCMQTTNTDTFCSRAVTCLGQTCPATTNCQRREISRLNLMIQPNQIALKHFIQSTTRWLRLFDLNELPTPSRSFVMKSNVTQMNLRDTCWTP